MTYDSLVMIGLILILIWQSFKYNSITTAILQVVVWGFGFIYLVVFCVVIHMLTETYGG